MGSLPKIDLLPDPTYLNTKCRCTNCGLRFLREFANNRSDVCHGCGEVGTLEEIPDAAGNLIDWACLPSAQSHVVAPEMVMRFLYPNIKIEEEDE